MLCTLPIVRYIDNIPEREAEKREEELHRKQEEEQQKIEEENKRKEAEKEKNTRLRNEAYRLESIIEKETNKLADFISRYEKDNIKSFYFECLREDILFSYLIIDKPVTIEFKYNEVTFSEDIIQRDGKPYYISKIQCKKGICIKEYNELLGNEFFYCTEEKQYFEQFKMIFNNLKATLDEVLPQLKKVNSLRTFSPDEIGLE